MELAKAIFIIFISFSSGMVISGAVFALIAAIGIIPNLAVKSNTTKYIRLYEEMIIFGGIFGCISTITNFQLPIGNNIFGMIFVIIFFICIGIFIGVLASSLAEVIDVIPIFSNRVNIKKGIALLLLGMAIGKGFGAVLYFINSSFQV